MQYRNIKKDFKRRVRRNSLSKTKPKFDSFLNRTVYQTILKTTSPKENACKSRIKNICLGTGFEKSILATFYASRHFFKKKVTQAHYPGVRKASW